MAYIDTRLCNEIDDLVSLFNAKSSTELMIYMTQIAVIAFPCDFDLNRVCGGGGQKDF